MKKNAEVSKDLVFAQPREGIMQNGTVGNKTQARDWTVAEVEEVLWRVRASGGTDSTPVIFRQGYGEDERALGMTIRALHIEASPIYEVPRRREPVCKACDDRGVLEGKECPVCRKRDDETQWWYKPAKIAGLLVALPAVATVLILIWRVLFWIAF